MNIKRGRKYLYQIRDTDREITKKLAELNRLRECRIPSGIRYDSVKVQTSAKNRLEELEAEIDVTEREIIRLKRRMFRKTMEIKKRLEDIPDDEALALTLYFIEGKAVEDIAETMHYSRSGIYKKMDAGIKRL